MRILVADDQAEITRCIADLCQEKGIKTTCVAKAEDAVAKVKADPSAWSLVIMDYDFGRRRKNGMEAFKEIHAIVPLLPVVFLTGQGTIALAVEAMKAGATDFVEKDQDLADNVELALTKVQRLLAVVEENKNLRQKNVELQGQVDLYHQELYRRYEIVGPALAGLFELVEKVAPIPRPVLIRGERGSGKELVARAIHKASPRSSGPFVTVNCAAFAEGLLECEVFGQEENAYNGAPFRRGRFELAHKGTLFLDEIGNMPLDFQQKVLRVLEYQSFERVGGGQTIKVDVRVLSATNADMEADMRRGRFREDLYDRLAFETITIPPLRDRTGDIGPMAAHFLQNIGLEVAGVVPKSFSPAALDVLRGYPWPGNVRELKFYVERLAYRVNAPVILPEHLPPPRGGEGGQGVDLAGRVLDYKKRLLTQALTDWPDDRDRAAGSLGVGRPELEALARECGLDDLLARSKPSGRLL